MNSLLPKIDDLEPIVDSRQIFSETPFIRDFYKLDDINNFYDCHFSVLVNGINNKTYLVDTTPDIGYGFCEVNDLYSRDLYNKYIVLDSDIIFVIDTIRNDFYDISRDIYNDKQIDNYKIWLG